MKLKIKIIFLPGTYVLCKYKLYRCRREVVASKKNTLKAFKNPSSD